MKAEETSDGGATPKGRGQVDPTILEIMRSLQHGSEVRCSDRSVEIVVKGQLRLKDLVSLSFGDLFDLGANPPQGRKPGSR
jgi:hypothetical protein